MYYSDTALECPVYGTNSTVVKLKLRSSARHVRRAPMLCRSVHEASACKQAMSIGVALCSLKERLALSEDERILPDTDIGNTASAYRIAHDPTLETAPHIVNSVLRSFELQSAAIYSQLVNVLPTLLYTLATAS